MQRLTKNYSLWLHLQQAVGGSAQRTGLGTECLHLAPDSITHSFVTENCAVLYLSTLSQIIHL